MIVKSHECFYIDRESDSHVELKSCLISSRYLPVKDGAHSSTVGAASVDMEACRQQDAVFYRDRAM